MFTDDIVKEITDQDLLQADLSQVFEWSHKWLLNFNSSKCETICILYNHSPPPANYNLNNHLLSMKTVTKILRHLH